MGFHSKTWMRIAFALLLSLVLMPSAYAQSSSTSSITAQQSSKLSQEEINGLLFTREEEKLARDVYQTLGATWKVSVFNNIAASEQNHMDAIKVLLDRYGLKDPVGNNGVGVFSNAQLQQWYKELISKGNTSLSAALRVGGEIEERDILDIQQLMAQTNSADLDRVYGSLLRGSENHLRAFVNNFQNLTGETYEPQFMSDDEFATIMDGSNGRGNGRRGRR